MALTNTSVEKKCTTHICARCAERFGSCCVAKEVNFDKLFPIANEEIELIKVAHNIKIIEVENTLDFQHIFFTLFPNKKEKIKEKYKIGSLRKCLAINSNGSCQFLSNTGCVLEREIRPNYCKIFPFWLVNNEIKNFNNDDCLATRNLLDINILLEHLNSTEDEVKQLYYKLVQLWLD